MEFLTAEDASAALSFDGSTLFGSLVRVRRPKDYVEVAVRMKILYIPALFYLYHLNIISIKVFDVFILLNSTFIFINITY